jgi:hypothetical protein
LLNITREDLITFAPDRPYRNYSWSSGDQTQVTPYATQGIRGAAFLAGAGATVGAFSVAKRFGYNPWDPIYSGIRTVEELSPGHIFRTFQLGNFVSQFTTQGLAPLDISADLIQKTKNSAWFADLVHRTGPATLSATQTGLQFRDGTLYAGEQVLLENARRMTSVGSPYYAAAYSRALGFKGLPNTTLPDHFQFQRPLVEGLTESIYFTGGPTRGRAALTQFQAIAGESIERANRLAAAPFGIEPFSTGLKGVEEFWERNFGTRFTLAVKSGSATETLGRMAGKWGGIGTAAYLAYQTADWATRNTEILDNTIFNEGITAGIATLGVKANKFASTIADILPGARAYREKQEELAPGSTSLLKLAAFPLTGAMVGGSAYYFTGLRERLKATNELMEKGLSYTQALPLAEQRWLETSTSFIEDNPLTRLLESKFGKNIPFLGKITRPKGFALLGALALTVPVLPFLPGALIPEKTSEELDKIYSGQEEVAVRKGRFWELGRSPYEGGKIEYFRPHWYARLMQRSYGKSMYDNQDPNPIVQWVKENFTYDVEKEHYYDRPYPITGTAFEDIPLIGPILGATIGRIIKPPKLMHTEEWLKQGSSSRLDEESEVLRTPGRLGEQAPLVNDASRGTPIDPNSLRQVAGEQAYRLTELSGLIGFTTSALKGAITGEQEFFDQEEVLQSARRMYGAERSFWDLNMGGAAFTNELFRRMYPHRRRQIEEYNPIRNTMPDWMPGPGERSADFLHGDPFTKVQEGEMRLPGEGYAARFPELSGINPEDYPLIHKYKILADIAPYADRTKALGAKLTGLANAGSLSEYELNLLQQVKRQGAERKKTKSFYQFEVTGESPDLTLPEELGATQSRAAVAALNRILAAKQDEKISPARSVIGGYWESLAKALQNPLEAIVPVAPGSKLLNMKSAIQEYKQTQVFGPDIAFWEHPIENFIRPFIRETADLFADQPVPEEVQKKRGIEEYFDILEYIKNKRLAEVARTSGASDVSGAYERMATETSVGINPYTRNYSALFRSLPRSERDYFQEFAGAKTQEERQQILSLVPPNLRRIYAAQWEQQYADTLKNALDRELLSGEAAQAAQNDLQAFYNKKATEGFPVNDSLIDRYQDEREDEETYADWFRRSVLIPGVVGEEGIPGPDWVGWHPGIDLDEIKLKVVKNEAMDIHDFNLWSSDERSVSRKSYLDDVTEDLIENVISNENNSPQHVQQEVRKILAELGIGSNAQIFVYEVPDNREETKIQIQASELRDREIREVLTERLNELG